MCIPVLRGLSLNKGAFKMRIIGLTGGTGSGKGAVSGILSENGAYIIDCDEIAHEVIKKGRPAYLELLEYFGDSVLEENGEIDRKKLGEIVFSDDLKRGFLNKCTHKYIGMEVFGRIFEADKKEYALAVIVCTEIWGVYADEETRVKRIVERDGISEEYAKNRISSQMKWDEMAAFFDFVIDNDGDINETRRQIENHLRGGKDVFQKK
mgnify:CR=1 FL=1